MSDNKELKKDKFSISMENLLNISSKLSMPILMFISIGLMGNVILGMLVVMSWLDINNFIITKLMDNFLAIIIPVGGIAITIFVKVSNYRAKKEKEKEIKLNRYEIRRNHLEGYLTELSVTNRHIGKNLGLAVERLYLLNMLVKDLHDATPLKLRAPFIILFHQLKILDAHIDNNNNSLEIEETFTVLFRYLMAVLRDIDNKIEDVLQ